MRNRRKEIINKMLILCQAVYQAVVPMLLLLLSHFSRVRLCATPETAAHQAPPSLGFSRQEYWSRLPGPPPGALSHPLIEPPSLMSPALAGVFLLLAPPGKLFKKKKKNVGDYIIKS